MRCPGCGLEKTRRCRVKGRGDIPAQVLFLGEAPGTTEELFGEAFRGMSGRLLDKAIKRAGRIARFTPTYYIGNVVQCRPTDRKFGPNREPTQAEIWKCRPRLLEIHQEVAPEFVVFLGRTAQHACRGLWDGLHLQHPAHICRQGGTESPEYRAFVAELVGLFQEAKRHAKRR